MDLGGKLFEIDSLDKEIKSLKKRASDLGKRKQTILNTIIDYYKGIGMESFEYKGKKHYIHQKNITTKKPEKDKHRDAMLALEKFGLYGEEARKALSEIKASLKGHTKTKDVIV